MANALVSAVIGVIKVNFKETLRRSVDVPNRQVLRREPLTI